MQMRVKTNIRIVILVMAARVERISSFISFIDIVSTKELLLLTSIPAWISNHMLSKVGD